MADLKVYAQKSDVSDILVYESSFEPKIICGGCSMIDHFWEEDANADLYWIVDSRQKMIRHMRAHASLGDRVTENSITAVTRVYLVEGDTIR